MVGPFAWLASCDVLLSDRQNEKIFSGVHLILHHVSLTYKFVACMSVKVKSMTAFCTKKQHMVMTGITIAA